MDGEPQRNRLWSCDGLHWMQLEHVTTSTLSEPSIEATYRWTSSSNMTLTYCILKVIGAFTWSNIQLDEFIQCNWDLSQPQHCVILHGFLFTYNKVIWFNLINYQHTIPSWTFTRVIRIWWCRLFNAPKRRLKKKYTQWGQPNQLVTNPASSPPTL